MNFEPASWWESLLGGLSHIPATATLTLVPTIVGLGVGMFVALATVFRLPVLRHILPAVIAVINGIPIVIMLFIFNVVAMVSFSTTGLVVGIAALSVSAIGSMSEAIRGAFTSIDVGQYEAAYAAGLTRGAALKRIILPQVIPVAIPVLTSSVIGIMKGSSIAIAIGIMEVTNGALLPAHNSYRYLEAYFAAALIYWVIAVALEQLSALIERRLTRHRKVLA